MLDPIIVSQTKIIKVICFRKPTAHAEPLFKELNLLKIHKIHELQLLSFVYGCQNNLALTHFQSYFTPSSNVHSFSTRQASRGDLFLTRKTTFQYGIRSIQYSDARLWNPLPVSIRESSSHASFVSQVNIHLLSQ